MSVKLSTKHLHYQKLSRSFFGEISELPNFSIEHTLRLVSHVTSNDIEFRLSDTKRDSDNDVIAWEYTPKNDNRVKKVIILND